MERIFDQQKYEERLSLTQPQRPQFSVRQNTETMKQPMMNDNVETGKRTEKIVFN